LIFIDSAYTERYLRMPADDPLAYAQGSLIGNDSSLLDAFSRVHLMLAHGIADDNVHFRHSQLLLYNNLF
jgi:dipeptidyl aminopeptidase/acylaminoacyl peptidase